MLVGSGFRKQADPTRVSDSIHIKKIVLGTEKNYHHPSLSPGGEGRKEREAFIKKIVPVTNFLHDSH
jgi:hypothetical protein